MTPISFSRYGGALGLFGLLGLMAAMSVQAADAGKVLHLVPGATLSRDGKTQSLQQDAVVRDTDVIVTDATGRVRILFNDGTALSFGGDTRIRLRDFAGAQKTAFSARLLQSAARSASNTIRAQNPGGFGGVRPTGTAGKEGMDDGKGAPVLVNVKGKIGAGLDYAFEFRMNLTTGVIFQGQLSDGGKTGDKAYSPDFSGGEGKIDEFGWRVDFVSGSVSAKDARGAAVTHRNWKVTLFGADTLKDLKALSAKGGNVRGNGFEMRDEKDAIVLEYRLAGSRAQAASGGVSGPPKFY